MKNLHVLTSKTGSLQPTSQSCLSPAEGYRLHENVRPPVRRRGYRAARVFVGPTCQVTVQGLRCLGLLLTALALSCQLIRCRPVTDGEQHESSLDAIPSHLPRFTGFVNDYAGVLRPAEIRLLPARKVLAIEQLPPFRLLPGLRIAAGMGAGAAEKRTAAGQQYGLEPRRIVSP